MAALQCEICGGKLIGKPGGIFECDSCGTEYSTEWASAKIQEIKGTVKVEGTVQVAGTVTIEGGISAASLLKRGELALEDREWDNARKAYDRALDISPENGAAYFGKLLAEYHVRNAEELSTLSREFTSSANYQKALRFADKALAQKLETVVRIIEEREEAQRREQARQAELARKQAEENRKKAQKNARNAAHAAKIALPILAAAIALVVIVNTVVLPMLTKKPKPEAPVATEAQMEAPATEAPSTEETAPSAEEIQYSQAEAWEADGQLGRAAIAFGKLGDYKDARERSFALWKGDTISAGTHHVVAIKKDGSVVAVGDRFGQDYCQVQDWIDIVSVAASDFLTSGLKSDGTVVVTSSEMLDFREAVSKWEDIVQISAAGRSVVGLKADGRIILVKQVAWENGVPIYDLDEDLRQWTDIVAISVCNGNQIAGRNTWENSPAIAGLRRDGTVVLHGFDEKINQKVSEWSDIVSIHAAGYGVCGRKADGTIVGAYLNQNIGNAVSKWIDIVDVDSSSVEGGVYIIGIRLDGTVAAWGDEGGLDGATSWKDIVSVDVGDITGQCFKRPIVGLKSDGTVVVTGWGGEQPDLSDFTDIRLPISNENQ